MLDDAQVKLFWGVLHGHLSIEIYSSHRKQWYMFRENLYSKGREVRHGVLYGVCMSFMCVCVCRV